MNLQKNKKKNTTGFFHSFDQSRKLFYETYLSTTASSSGYLVITHGLGEHSGAYRLTAEYIAEKTKLNVITWDMVGHGKSSGQRGYVGDISWMTKDLSRLLSVVQSDNSKPLFLLSHSLGGLISLAFEQQSDLTDFNVKGLILSNPCTKLSFEPPKWKTSGAEVLNKIAPRLTLGNEIKPEQLSSDLDYIEEYKKDPLRHSKVSPRLYTGMLQLMSSINQSSISGSTPRLTLLSSKDPICDAKNTQRLLADKSKIVFFDHSMHEVLNDKEKQSALLKIEEFINENI